MKKICVIGIGYVGLPTAAILASKGQEVIGYDTNKKVIEALNEGKITIEEPGLEELVKKGVESGNLKGSSKCPKGCDIYIIAVPTPINLDKTADMSYVKKATEEIAKNLKKDSLVILESTSPPKTVEDIVIPILKKSGLKIGDEVLVSHSPERILPGKVLEELRLNSRIVGGINEKSSIETKKMYELFVEGEIFLTNSKTAEMCKVMENTFRDVNIALANELAKISEELGVNAWEVIKLANCHPRVSILNPSPGVGGHCIALDPWFLVEKSKNANLIKKSREINDSMPKFVFNKIKNILGEFKNQTIAILGVTYKPDIDDLRESPIMNLINMLKEEKINLKICDPHVEGKIENNFELYEAVKGTSLVVLGVNHSIFKNVDFKKIAQNLKEKNILDTRNFWNEEDITKNKINYYLLGRS